MNHVPVGWVGPRALYSQARLSGLKTVVAQTVKRDECKREFVSTPDALRMDLFGRR